MYKAKQKTVSLIVACLTFFVTIVMAFACLFSAPTINVASAAEATATLTFDNKSKRTSFSTTIQVWEENGIVFTNNKASSTNNVADYAKPARLYANSQIIVEYSADITKIVFDCNSSSYATALKNSIGSTATANSDKVTVTLATPAKSLTIAKLTAQVRMDAITVTYTESSTPTCEHTNTTTTTVDATCTTAGSKTTTCHDCGDVKTETIPATGHNYKDGDVITSASCTENGEMAITCENCGDETTKTIPAMGHNYENGTCTECGEEQPTSATLTFDDKAKRTEFTTGKQEWKENGITLTNNKGDGINIADYANPVRFYKSSEIVVKCDYMTKIEFTCSSSEYTTNLINSITGATANGNVVTIEFTTAQNEFKVNLSAGQVRMYSITVHTERPGSAECKHTNTHVETTPATCTEKGMNKTVCECGTIVSEEEIPALGHNYVDNFCGVCGEQDPATIDYSGYYYIAFKRSASNYFYVGNTWDSRKDKERYVATDSQLTVLESKITAVNMNYVFRIEKNTNGAYSIYEAISDTLFAGGVENVTIIDNKNGTFSIKNADDVYFSFNNSTGSDYIKWYTSAQVRELALIPAASASIMGASITLGETLTMNYYVTLLETYENVTMNFTMDGETTANVNGEKVADGQYKFSFEVPPQYMGAEIDANLMSGDVLLAEKNDYSIKKYAESKLTAQDSSEELKQLITDMLYYGAEAQKYINYNVENLVTDGVNPSEVKPEETDSVFSYTSDTENATQYFVGADVWFGDVNKLVIEIATTEDVTLTINGKEVNVESTTIITEGIIATDFDKVFTFVIECNGVTQTLTYSVNSYLYAMQSNPTVRELALALYRYGASAEAYAPTANN